ncbi:MAG: ECF-type riboflavin transporter substrate-binding protein [Lachnospiraceae bacterium]|nr:ECF-type riboflavin transporter substrate-binding protein [Lachnospiraceae bacterium]
MKKKVVITVVATAIGAALFFVLARFVSIPSFVPNVNLALQYGLLAFISGVFGPVAGALSGLIGHFFADLSFGWGVWWSWVITSGFFGCMMGIIAKLMKLDEDFSGKKILWFNVAQALVNLVSWAIIAPLLDIVIYQEPAGKVFLQGIVSAGINILATAVVGTLLYLAWSAARPKKGSLKEEE